MSDKEIVLHCAPTLAGLKTGSLFSYFIEDRENISQEIRKLNRVFVPKGLCLLPLYCCENRVLMYLYRPEYLKKDLIQKEAAEILEKYGYKGKSCGQCLQTLKKRISEEGGFPHEIGLFLSYPPEDVNGFIERKVCKFVGYWKVYGNEVKARDTFEKYRKCTEQYCRALDRGQRLDKLAVAK